MPVGGGIDESLAGPVKVGRARRVVARKRQSAPAAGLPPSLHLVVANWFPLRMGSLFRYLAGFAPVDACPHALNLKYERPKGGSA